LLNMSPFSKPTFYSIQHGRLDLGPIEFAF
jgi:hypothetical protein